MSYTDNFSKMQEGFDMGQAIAEADRCLLCHDAPCSKGCPAETDPASFIRKLRFRNISGAVRTIKTNNILGGACGVLCPTAELCEKECSATGIGQPIAIGKIQRFLVEHAHATGFEVVEKKGQRSEKVAVVGSGPAGLSCAAELAKEGFPVTVFETRGEPGGVLRYGVVSYRFDTDFLASEMADIQKLGVEFKCGSPIDGQNGVEDLLKNGYQAVFLAPGLWDAVRLKEKTDIAGLYGSVAFLEGLRDGHMDALAGKIENKTVAVIGGGSVAMDCVGASIRLGAKDVYLVYRRSYTQMPAEEDEKIEALDEGIHFLLLNQPVDYVVGDDGCVQGLKLVRTALGDTDASGRRSPINIEGSEWVLPADLVIEAIGNKADDRSPTWYPQVKLDGKKLIQVDPDTGKTSMEGVFAGGDIVRGPALVVNAVQDGKVAARAIKDYLNQD
ncbi:MAG: FAD-dependent oxidoreductase [Thermodesulfobacteriota bacterium]